MFKILVSNIAFKLLKFLTGSIIFLAFLCLIFLVYIVTFFEWLLGYPFLSLNDNGSFITVIYELGIKLSQWFSELPYLPTFSLLTPSASGWLNLLIYAILTFVFIYIISTDIIKFLSKKLIKKENTVHLK